MAQRRPDNTDDLDPTPVVLRLKTRTIAEIKRRAAVDRRPFSQWLRLFVEDALHLKKESVK